MTNEVVLISIQEVEWNVCKLTVVCLNSEIKQFLVTQTEVLTFAIKEHAGLPQLFQKLTPF